MYIAACHASDSSSAQIRFPFARGPPCSRARQIAVERLGQQASSAAYGSSTSFKRVGLSPVSLMTWTSELAPEAIHLASCMLHVSSELSRPAASAC